MSAVMPLDQADLERRFGGLRRLYGDAGYQRLRSLHVAVVGLGGVGSWAVEALARSGVRALTLFDLDHVAESNINRQIQALSSTIGMAKIDAMRERILQINPSCKVHCVDDFVTPDNWPQLLPHTVDAVLDACDQIRTKAALGAWARENKKTIFISAGAAGGKRLAHKVDIADLSQTTHDPLLAQMRYQLRKHHHAPRDGKNMAISCVFSREAVKGPDASCQITDTDNSLNCHGYGSLAGVTATFGMCAAAWILDRIAEN